LEPEPDARRGAGLGMLRATVGRAIGSGAGRGADRAGAPFTPDDRIVRTTWSR
jgi:hypothetical protein